MKKGNITIEKDEIKDASFKGYFLEIEYNENQSNILAFTKKELEDVYYLVGKILKK